MHVVKTLTPKMVRLCGCSEQGRITETFPWPRMLPCNRLPFASGRPMPSASTRAALCAALVFAAPSLSLAQESNLEPTHEVRTEKRDAEARALFAAGKSAFEDGRYDDALLEFKRAYERSGRPELLYNVGLAAMELKRDEEALVALQSFVAAVPEAKTLEYARLRIELLQARIAQRNASAAPSSETSINAPKPAIPTLSHDVPRRRPYTWVAGGISVALGATALGVGLKAQRDYSDLRRACRVDGEAICTRARVDDEGLERRALATNLLAAGAGVALAAGIVLFFYEGRERPGATVSARIGPHSISLLGSFR